MPSVYDPSSAVLPSEEEARAIEPRLMFSRTTIRAVYIGVIAAGIGLVLWAAFSNSALLTPVDPNLRAGLIGLGVFLGVLVAVIEREAWLLGFGGQRAPKGIFVGVAMLALIALGGFGGDFVASKIWEWRAFHGIHPIAADRAFTVLMRSNGRSGGSLRLSDSATGQAFRIGCTGAMVAATRDGDRLLLTVETGRGGVERVSLPAPRDLRKI